MGLIDRIEELKKEEAEAIAALDNPVEEEKEVEEKEKPEVEKEEAKVEPVEEEKHPARLRREAAAERKAREKAEAEAADLRAENAKLKEKPEVESEELPDVIKEIAQSHYEKRAEEEFMGHEQEVKRKHDDYEAVTAAYAQDLFRSFKVQNPDLNDMQARNLTKNHLLQQASRYVNSGYENPAEEMYLRAKELGFKAQPKEEEKRPDIAKIAANRARNAGTASAAGATSEGQLTASSYASMTVRERMKLKKEEVDRIVAKAR